MSAAEPRIDAGLEDEARANEEDEAAHAALAEAVDEIDFGPSIPLDLHEEAAQGVYAALVEFRLRFLHTEE